MADKINVLLLAEELLRLKTSGMDDVDIKLFPSPLGNEKIIINPFLLSFRLDSGAWCKSAVTFGEYPARMFPNVIFKYVPACPLHPSFPHPNINHTDGLLNIRPTISHPYINVEHSINIIRGLLVDPLHYSGACSISYMPENPLKVMILSSPPPVQEEQELNLFTILKTVGEAASIINGLTDLGQLVIKIIGFFHGFA